VEEENDNEFANAVNNDGKKDYHENCFLELLKEFEKEKYCYGPLSERWKQLLNYFHYSRKLMQASNYIQKKKKRQSILSNGKCKK